MRRSTVLAIACVIVAAGAAGPQTAVDEGSFSISVRGQRVGREDFRIVASPGPTGGTTYTATASIAYEDRRLTPSLSTDEQGSPTDYRLDVKVGPETQESLRGTFTRGRLSLRSRTLRGEMAREYVVADGTILLDDEVFHQYFFLGRRRTGGAVPVIVPRRNSQTLVRVALRGSEPVTIGGRAIQAEHLAIDDQDGTTRDVWIDAAGHVLRVAIPSRGVLAVREDPPN